jgi:hypothetical protein
MEQTTRRPRRLSRLFNVLVAGGIALALGCPKTQSSGKPEKPADGGASSKPASEPESPSGVRGW